MLLLDRRLPDLDAEELLQIIHRRFPGIDVLWLDEAGQPALPSQWRSAGGLHLFETIGRWQAPALAPTAAGKAAAPVEPLPEMIGQAACMATVYRMARLVAPRNTRCSSPDPRARARKLSPTRSTSSARAPASPLW